MLNPICVCRIALDERSSGDRRKRVDAYFVEYPHPQGGVWVCRFEVPVGSSFLMQAYANQKEAIAARGFSI